MFSKKPKIETKTKSFINQILWTNKNHPLILKIEKEDSEKKESSQNYVITHFPSPRLSACFDRASSTWLYSLYICWISTLSNTIRRFMIFLFQPSNEATCNLHLLATKSVMTFESPHIYNWESNFDLAIYSKKQRESSSPLVLVPLPQPIWILYTLEALHFKTNPSSHFSPSSLEVP